MNQNQEKLCLASYQHNFEARYDESSTIDQEALDKGIKHAQCASEIFNMNDCKLSSKTYLFDICKICGLKIKRDE